MAEGNISLGDRVKDRLTGTTGIVTSITHWLYGCTRIGIQPENANNDGSKMEPLYIDEPQCELVCRQVHKPVTMTRVEQPVTAQPGTGGPARETSNFRR